MNLICRKKSAYEKLISGVFQHFYLIFLYLKKITYLIKGKIHNLKRLSGVV